MAALLRRENINLNQIESNVQQQIQNADLAKKETIKNIKSASDLLIGDRDTQFKQGLEVAEVQGKGVLLPSGSTSEGKFFKHISVMCLTEATWSFLGVDGPWEDEA